MDGGNLKQKVQAATIQKPSRNASSKRAPRGTDQLFEEIEKQYYEDKIDVNISLLDPLQTIYQWERDSGSINREAINICRVSQESSRYYVLQGARIYEILGDNSPERPQTWPARVFNTSILSEPLLQIWIYRSQNVNGRRGYRIGDVLALLAPHEAQGEQAFRSAVRYLGGQSFQTRVFRMYRMPYYKQLSRIFANNGPFGRVMVGDLYFLVQTKAEKYIALTHQLLDDLDRQCRQLQLLTRQTRRSELYSEIAASHQDFTYHTLQGMANVFADEKVDPTGWANSVLRPENPYVIGEVVPCPSSFGRPLRLLYHGWVLRVHMLCLFTGSDVDSSLSLISKSVEGVKVLRELMNDESLAVDTRQGPDVDEKSQDWVLPRLDRKGLLNWAKSRIKKDSLPSWSRFFQHCSSLGLQLSSNGASVLRELLSPAKESPSSSVQPSQDMNYVPKPRHKNAGERSPQRTEFRSLSITFPGSASMKKEVVLKNTVSGKTRTISPRSVDATPPPKPTQVKTHVTAHAGPMSTGVIMDEYIANKVPTPTVLAPSDPDETSTPPPNTPSDDTRSQVFTRKGSSVSGDSNISIEVHKSPEVGLSRTTKSTSTESGDESPPPSFAEACNDLSGFWIAFENDARVRQYWTPKLVQWMREDYQVP